MNKIKFIYFDLGGVFFHWRIGLRRLAERFGQPFDGVQGKGFEGVRVKYDDSVCKGQMMTEKLWEKFQEELNFSAPTDFDFAEEWVKSFEPIVESHQLAREVIKKYPVGVLTNVYPHLYEIQIDLGLVPNLAFNPIIKSCDLGLVKPDEKIYQLATQKAGILPSGIFYTDDLKINIEAAKKLGWQAIWFDENNPKKSIAEIRKRLLLPGS